MSGGQVQAHTAASSPPVRRIPFYTIKSDNLRVRNYGEKANLFVPEYAAYYARVCTAEDALRGPWRARHRRRDHRNGTSARTWFSQGPYVDCREERALV